ncbi:oxidoreductase [Halobacteriales archaeon QS_8_65_32]|jgi:UDP-glucose 4-epimerase|nr:MAG: oxidoreductase [Halobacteriales archaeon QS_8_65_32]
MNQTHTVGVTGSGGYIGSRVVGQLHDEGYDTVPIDDFSNAQVGSIDGRRIADVDIRDRNELCRTFEGVDAIAHLAAVSGVPDCSNDPERAFDINVGGTENVAWICNQLRIPLVFASSAAALGPPTDFPITATHPRKPTTFYGRTKAMNEDDVHQLAHDAFPAHVLLQANLYGDHRIDGKRIDKDVVTNVFVRRALAGEPLEIHEPGTQTFDFVHVEDVARAYSRSVEALFNADPGAETVVLGSGENLSVREVADLVQTAAREERGLSVDVTSVANPRGNDTTGGRDFTVETAEAADALGFVPEHDVETTVRGMLRRRTPSRSRPRTRSWNRSRRCRQ